MLLQYLRNRFTGRIFCLHITPFSLEESNKSLKFIRLHIAISDFQHMEICINTCWRLHTKKETQLIIRTLLVFNNFLVFFAVTTSCVITLTPILTFKFFQQDFIHLLRIGFALRSFHDLSDKKPQHFRALVFRRSTIVFYLLRAWPQ
jgi:hypothetical protein